MLALWSHRHVSFPTSAFQKALREYTTHRDDVTADFEFDVPVRFNTDHMAVTNESYQLHAWQQIPIVELRS
jgi:uncharacterized protein (TIGR02217 family)